VPRPNAKASAQALGRAAPQLEGTSLCGTGRASSTLQRSQSASEDLPDLPRRAHSSPTGASYRGADHDRRRRSESSPVLQPRQGIQPEANLRTGANPDCWRPL